MCLMYQRTRYLIFLSFTSSYRARTIDINYSEDGGTILFDKFASFMYTHVVVINLNKYYDSISQEITGQSVPVNYIDLKNIPRP